MIFEYKIIRSSRKTVSIQVDTDCNITVRAPYKISEREIEEFVSDKKEWLEKAVLKQMNRNRNKKEYTDDEIKILREKAKTVLPEKVKYYSSIMDVYPKSIKINSAKKRYGSCSGENNINFSLFLMDKDERFIDYVVVHELAHIKHHNHSKAFYGFIESFMPDYKERKKLG
ncbi:MAG: M48 family metallopeptidase [Clostridia bacterium]|nr:M48 family metallopeptidase [Clostridia bacterium]